MTDKLYKELDIVKRFNYLYGNEYSVNEFLSNLPPISRNPEVTLEDITAFLGGECVSTEKVQAILCMDFKECWKFVASHHLEFNRTAEWSKTGNGQDITTQFRINQNRWIKCSEQMPPEHDSIFAKFKGTDKWITYMFEKCSNDVSVTVEFEDGTRKVEVYRTLDGRWNFPYSTKRRAIAWQPLPEEYKGSEF